MNLDNNNLLKLENICLNYKVDSADIKILQDINLSIKTGRKYAITGKSGSGKTSLIMLMAGLEQSSSGKIFFQNSVISNFSQNGLTRYRRNNIGIIFQSFFLIPNYTVEENINIVLEINQEKNIKKRTDEIINKCGLSHRQNHYPHQLSGGEQQRVAIARAIVNKPSLILADEPTGNLDEDNTKQIHKLLTEVCEEKNSSLILVTHDLDLAKSCDEQIFIKDGKIQSKN